MARSGLFHRRDVDRDGVPDRVDAPVDRDHDGVDDRTETRIVDRDQDGVDDRVESPTERRDAVAPVVDRDRDGVDDRVEERPTSPAPAAVPVVTGRPRTSFFATFGLILGTVSVCVALTGRLAPAAIALGVLGLLFGLGGVSAGARANVAGRGPGALAVVLSAVGLVFGILAMAHATWWLDTDADQVAKLRDWLNVQLPWMKDW